MKIARIGCMVLGIALLMFVIANVASAQEGWYQGKVSVKGNEILTSGFDKVSGNGKIFVRILVDDVNTEYDVYTCTQGEQDTDWFGVWNYLPYANVYTDQGSEIWDFSVVNLNFNRGGGPLIVSKPMFQAKYSGTDKVDFKSFGCIFKDTTEDLSLGSCTISFKRIATDKVADKVSADCLLVPPPHP
jgi:hypothetical protein